MNKTITQLTTMLLLCFVVSCDNSQSPKVEKIHFNPNDEVQMGLKVELTYKVERVSFSPKKERYYLDGKRIYTITNDFSVDLTINPNFTRRSRYENGVPKGTVLNGRDKTKDKLVEIKAGQAVVLESEIHINGSGDSSWSSGLQKKDMTEVHETESFIVLPFEGDDNYRAIVGKLYTEEVKWDLSGMKLRLPNTGK